MCCVAFKHQKLHTKKLLKVEFLNETTMRKKSTQNRTLDAERRTEFWFGLKNRVQTNGMCKCVQRAQKRMIGKMETQIENWPRIVDVLLNMSCLHFAFSHKVQSVSEHYMGSHANKTTIKFSLAKKKKCAAETVSMLHGILALFSLPL